MVRPLFLALEVEGRTKRQGTDIGATEEQEVKEHCRASLEGNSLANTSFWPGETNIDCLIHTMVR